jgi:hypothetical protein
MQQSLTLIFSYLDMFLKWLEHSLQEFHFIIYFEQCSAFDKHIQIVIFGNSLK